jgi:integrase
VGRRTTGGIDARAHSIRLRFQVGGKREVGTLNLPPTAANMKAAARTLAEIQKALHLGVYQRSDFFEEPAKPAPAAAPKGAQAAVKAETFDDFADLYLAQLEATGERATIGVNRNYVAHWKTVFGGRLMTAIRHVDAMKATTAYAKRLSPKSGQPISGKAVNNAVAPLRAIFQIAVDDDTLVKSPLDKIKQASHQSPLPDPFTDQEMTRILRHMQTKYDPQARNWFDFQFGAGTRPSEAIAVRWNAVDWEGEKIKIEAAFVRGKRKATKTDRVRWVDLTPPALAALRRQHAITGHKGPNAPIFENPATGRPWADERQQRLRYFHPTLAALGIRSRDAYQTRHTFATRALSAGIIPIYISRQLGHADTAMLFKVYATWLDGADQGAEKNRMKKLFGAPVAADCGPVLVLEAASEV